MTRCECVCKLPWRLKWRLLNLSLMLVGCVLLFGCATYPFERHQPQPLPVLTAQQLVDNWWLAPGHRYLCRHSGLLEVFMRKVPLEGVVKIDTTEQTARLVAMDTMGVKLFDLFVTKHSHQLNYLLPMLEEHPQLPKMVAQSLRAIFLHPNPSPQDRLIRRERRSVLVSADVDGSSFEFIGMPVRLNRKVVDSTANSWNVEYNQYRDQNGLWAPTGIVLTDVSGFRLTLWIQEIRELQ